MKFVRSKKALRLSSLLVVAALAVGLSGCSVEHRTDQTGVSQDELSAGGEPYFWAGPISYQVQISRQLNPYDPVDVQYLAGVAGAQDLKSQQFWYAIFLWAKNQTNRYVTTTDTFKLLDSDGQVFSPTPLNASVNPYAWTAQTLAPDGIEPMADSTASNASAGGGLILFKLDQNVYSNRPLTLLVYAPGSTKPSRVSLDL
ncbi:MAG TPA: hypothetical protein VHV75_17265 [Solirubrobacteraceae bacterium]|nr:hypothetical protein [Solirubrobacteraceae bacterium]